MAKFWLSQIAKDKPLALVHFLNHQLAIKDLILTKDQVKSHLAFKIHTQYKKYPKSSPNQQSDCKITRINSSKNNSLIKPSNK